MYLRAFILFVLILWVFEIAKRCNLTPTDLRHILVIVPQKVLGIVPGMFLMYVLSSLFYICSTPQLQNKMCYRTYVGGSCEVGADKSYSS